jgi:hypothetical protein
VSSKHVCKIVLVSILASVNCSVFAANHKLITNYSDLLIALSQGDEVRAIIAVNKCTPASDNSKDFNDTYGSLNFTNFNKYQLQVNGQSKDVIATSINMLVKNDQLGSVYNYVRLRVFQDGSAELFSQFLNPVTYAQLQSGSFNCHLSNGQDQNAVALYDLS